MGMQLLHAQATYAAVQTGMLQFVDPSPLMRMVCLPASLGVGVPYCGFSQSTIVCRRLKAWC